MKVTRHLTDWNAVPVGSIGAPHGGRFGSIMEMVPKLAEHGFKLCWQWKRNCYAVYMEPRPGELKYVLALQRGLGGEPIPLTDTVLWTLAYCRERAASMSGDDVMGVMAKMDAVRKKHHVKEAADRMAAEHRERRRERLIRKGVISRPVMVN